MRTQWMGKPASGGKGAGKPASGSKGEGNPAGSKGEGKPACGGKPAFGGKGKPAWEENTFVLPNHTGSGHYVRMATVTGLPELCSRFGHIATARELYEWWGQARVLVHKRVHGASNPARREAARRRYEGTGHWGWG